MRQKRLLPHEIGKIEFVDSCAIRETKEELTFPYLMAGLIPVGSF